jgi:DNA adenine methylase
VKLATADHEIAGAVLKPPLKWAGGKRWQIPHLIKHWERESHRRLVEPFCGGLSVALGLNPDQALLNDINPHLINFYNWLKRGLVIKIQMSNDASCFYSARDRFNKLLRARGATTKEAASLFYYLNRTGYNGLCRFNGSGAFNVPFGTYKSINYQRTFIPYKSRLSEWEFSNSVFDDIQLEGDDFVYADPPYDVVFTQYSKGGFSWEDQVRTAEWLSRHPGPVVLSNQATSRVRKLYRKLKFKLIYLEAPRRISCTGDRAPATEILALRNLN